MICSISNAITDLQKQLNTLMLQKAYFDETQEINHQELITMFGDRVLWDTYNYY
ncbi:MAG: hypothetical protein AAGF26_00900 [Cyanobacteria bacterium P01_G01_bin.49]